MQSLKADYFGFVLGTDAERGHGYASVARCKSCGEEFYPHPLSSLQRAMNTHSRGSCESAKFEVE